MPAPRGQNYNMHTPPDESGTDRGIDVVIDVTATPEREFGEVVLSAIADELGADPTTLPPIADSIEPDVLNEFLDEDGASAKVLGFEYLGCDVAVTSGGVVRLRSLP